MRNIRVSLLIAVAIVMLAPQMASARLFRRAYATQSYTTTRTYSATPTTWTNTTATVRTASYGDVSTAQGVAAIMARLNRVGHFGGNRGYEGCGCGATPQAAYNICCYANSGMATVDVGYAQAANGMWYCCRRYR